MTKAEAMQRADSNCRTYGADFEVRDLDGYTLLIQMVKPDRKDQRGSVIYTTKGRPNGLLSEGV